ncbi:hypothetical protein [Clostridium sp.]|uniref:hypothetical protein n=1 Tax=Clostridium sp. TaxID=1506 RepID=UPI002A917BE1|nr:hypothetical protein [Clostridium sp.]MDY6012040.1 hypothetical protein [Clostridium sp.]
MNFKVEKNLKIITELMSFCYHFSAKDITVNIKTIDNTSNIVLDAIIKDFPKDDYDNLIQALSIPRQHEVEQYYWHLGGESEFDCELSLVGMMVDNTNIKYENDRLHIELQRLE